MVRKHLTTMIPKNHPLWTVWMCQPEIPGKCLMQMKIDELYRDVSTTHIVESSIEKIVFVYLIISIALPVHLP
jgi:hypothetical protein